MTPFRPKNFISHMLADKNVAHKYINSNNIIQRNLINNNKKFNQWGNHLMLSIIIKDDDNTFIIVRSAKCCRLCLVLQR